VYLYRALDKCGNTIDFYLSHTHNTSATKLFLRKALKSIPKSAEPNSINTDKNPAYGKAITALKTAGCCGEQLIHRQIKYLNNIIESDHGKLKRLVKPTLGFKSMKTAYGTIRGFEVMLMFKEGQLKPWQYNRGVHSEIVLITDALLTA
jgi:transposase-like protein